MTNSMEKVLGRKSGTLGSNHMIPVVAQCLPHSHTLRKKKAAQTTNLIGLKTTWPLQPLVLSRWGQHQSQGLPFHILAGDL